MKLKIIIILAALAMIGPGRAGEPTEAPADTDLTFADIQPKAGPPKLDSALATVANYWRAGEPGQAREYGFKRRMDLSGDSVRVVAEALVEPLTSSASLRARTAVLATKISQLGGRTELRHDNLVQFWIPIDALEILSADPLVKFVRPPRRPFKQVYHSEGVAKTGADAWHDLPAYRSEGTGVCILDAGFEGYKSLQGSELPDKVTVKSFRADGDNEADDHGAACAEIVHDMAPDVPLTLVSFDTDVEQHEAVDWILRQDIGVISYSMGWYNGGAGDGTGPICDDVRQAADKDVLWASAAGNAAVDHWDGFFTDNDGDGFHNFTPADEILTFTVPGYEPVGAFLNWKDFGLWNGYDYAGSDQDYDLYLYYWTGSSWQFVEKATNHQTGAGSWPTEELYGFYSVRDTVWGVSIYRYSGTKNVRLELFTYNNSDVIEHNVPERSIIVPADSPDAIAAGATDWSNDALHYYSGRGPSHGGLTKPDVTAPSGVSTDTYGTRNFYGTSASAPHLAGGLALFRSMTPFSAAQVRSLIQKRAVDLGATGKDNLFGYGRLQLKR